KTLPLERFGLDWIHPEIPLAHPLDDGSAACLHRDVDLTSDSLGADADAYRKLMAPLARDWEKLSAEFLQPVLHLPQHPFALAKYFVELGGKIDINCRIGNLDQLPKSRVTLFDTTVWQFARIARERLPDRYRHRLESFRHAPGIFKIDYALSSPIPWKADACR